MKQTNNIKKSINLVLLLFVCIPAFSMHIMEGYLPVNWAVTWSLAFLPVLLVGINRVKVLIAETPEKRMILAMVVAFAFVLSSLKLPSVTGSSSHATGMGFGTALVGPASMAVVGTVVLLFQMFLLAHGGITTLGANAFAMAFAGPIVTFLVYRLFKKLGASMRVAFFFAAVLGNLFTYLVTSTQLALAHPDGSSGVMGAFAKFVGIFGITQVPVAIVEGLLSVMVINVLINNDFVKESDLFSFNTFNRLRKRKIAHEIK